tara:strand:+ start:668 stop:1051 length:384 start_codon:yes stop_codon:yes gene_type:complete
MNWKETYTKVFLKQKGMAISDVTLKQYLSEWWQNTRAKEQGGLRLTDTGFEFVRNELDLATYDVPFPKDFEMTTNTIIWLDQFITCPYYLFKNSIVVLDERKAMELHLFSGDIKKYGLTKAMNRHKK